MKAVIGNNVEKGVGFKKNCLVMYKCDCTQMVLGDQDKLLSNHAEVLDCHFFDGASTASGLC